MEMKKMDMKKKLNELVEESKMGVLVNMNIGDLRMVTRKVCPHGI